MVEQKREENKFKFVLYKNSNTIIDEKYFSADNYSPRIRNSVDIRDEVEEIIFRLQEVLKNENGKQQKREENKFKFVLYKNNSTIIERYFSADDYNIRMSNNEHILTVRDEVNKIVSRLENILKKKDCEYLWEQFDLEQKGYNKYSTRKK